MPAAVAHVDQTKALEREGRPGGRHRFRPHCLKRLHDTVVGIDPHLGENDVELVEDAGRDRIGEECSVTRGRDVVLQHVDRATQGAGDFQDLDVRHEATEDPGAETPATRGELRTVRRRQSLVGSGKAQMGEFGFHALPPAGISIQVDVDAARGSACGRLRHGVLLRFAAANGYGIAGPVRPAADAPSHDLGKTKANSESSSSGLLSGKLAAIVAWRSRVRRI